MAECMDFPATVEEFMEQYKITDTEQVYTNGMELVPIFRMKQWFEHLADTNVGNIEYISKQDAVDDLHTQLMYRMGSDDMKRRLDDWVKTLPSADAIPYSIESDGTLTITVPKGTTANRVLVQEDGTQWGGLFYAD